MKPLIPSSLDISPKEHSGLNVLRRLPHIALLVCAIGIPVVAYAYMITPPKDFPAGRIMTVKDGESLNSISSGLESSRIIRNAEIFLLLAKLSGRDRTIASGEYLFDQPITSTDVLERLSTGDHGVREMSVTIPEGFDRADIAKKFASVLPEFNASEFLSLSKDDEGYLFPDTYRFYQNADAVAVYAAMRRNFDARAAGLREEVETSRKPFADIVTLASIVEKEVSGDEDRKIVAGIFMKRLRLGMPLQADATLAYLNGKTSSELTGEDLDFDSPYNTYAHKGLPPTPIASPGIEAMRAVIDAADSSYLYYLSGKDGATHYARTFEEHKLNKERYLR